jgi:hypothetical protein
VEPQMADKPKLKKGRRADGSNSLTLIVSDEKSPEVAIKPGMKIEVISVSLQTPTLKKAKATAAYLCGGSSTCIALTDVE